MSRHLLCLITVLLLSACSNIGVQRKNPTPITAIGLEEAERIAVETGRNGSIEIDPSSVAPRVIQAELITLQEAFDRQNSSVPKGDDPQTLVWYIQLEGLWKDAFPRQPADPTPESFSHMTVMIDSQTGGLYSVGTSQ
jgi:hypothetical protein